MESVGNPSCPEGTLAPDAKHGSANKGYRTQTIERSEFSHSVQDDHGSASDILRVQVLALRPAHSTAVVRLHLVYHGFHPFHMPRGEYQEEIGVLHLQATID